MKKSIFYCYFLCCLSFSSNAQNGKDYILTLQKDTLFGEILMEQGLDPIIFKHKGLKIQYYPSSIQFFGILKDNKYHHFKSLKSKYGRAVFAQIMATGKTQLYKYSEKHLFPNSTLSRFVYLMGATDNQLTTISSSSYQRILRDFFKDTSTLLSQLTNTSFDDVPKLIKQHNKFWEIKN